MGDIERVVKAAREIEAILERDFRAEGKGLHEKVGSVEGRLPGDLVRKIRFLATIRNKTVHEEFDLDKETRNRFDVSFKEAKSELRRLSGRRAFPFGCALPVALGLLAFCALLL